MTPQTDKATARPWHESHHTEYKHIVFAGGVPLAECQPNCSKEMQLANAALIVKSVNEYESLIALEAACRLGGLPATDEIADALKNLSTLRNSK